MPTFVDLPLSGPNGSTAFTDNTGRVWSRPATAGNNAQIQDNALLLDGNGDYISTPGTADLTFQDRIAVIEFEFKTSQSIAGGTIALFDYDNTNTGGWLLGIRGTGSPGSLGLYNSSDGYVVSSTMALNDGNWHSVKVELISRSVRFTIDGVSNATGSAGSSSFSRLSTALKIGIGDAVSQNFAGSIRNVKIYSPDPAPAVTRSYIRNSYIGWDNVKKVPTLKKWELYRHPEARVIIPRQFRITRGVPPWWGSAGSTTQLPTYKIRGRVMIRDEVTGEDTPLPNIRVALFFRRLHTLIDIQLSDANGYVQFDNLMPGVQAYYGIAFDKDGTPLHNSVLWDRLSSEPGP